MRVTKYKGKHKSMSQLCEVAMIDFIHDEVYFDSDVGHDINDCVIVEFTGVKVGGIDVYEGDVFQFGIGFKMQRGVVIFHKGAFRFDINKPFFASRTIAYDAIKRKNSKATIIGNIHENPELIS